MIFLEMGTRLAPTLQACCEIVLTREERFQWCQRSQEGLGPGARRELVPSINGIFLFSAGPYGLGQDLTLCSSVVPASRLRQLFPSLLLEPACPHSLLLDWARP